MILHYLRVPTVYYTPNHTIFEPRKMRHGVIAHKRPLNLCERLRVFAIRIGLDSQCGKKSEDKIFGKHRRGFILDLILGCKEQRLIDSRAFDPKEGSKKLLPCPWNASRLCPSLLSAAKDKTLRDSRSKGSAAMHFRSSALPKSQKDEISRLAVSQSLYRRRMIAPPTTRWKQSWRGFTGRGRSSSDGREKTGQMQAMADEIGLTMGVR